MSRSCKRENLLIQLGPTRGSSRDMGGAMSHHCMNAIWAFSLPPVRRGPCRYVSRLKHSLLSYITRALNHHLRFTHSRQRKQALWR